jgi:hypothetical protein
MSHNSYVGPHHMKDSVTCRIPLARQYPIATVQCEHYQRRCLYSLRVSHLSAGPPNQPRKVQRTVNVVFEDGRFVDGREVSVRCSARQQSRPALPYRTYPRVKTLSRDVLPHAPSPLCGEMWCQLIREPHGSHPKPLLPNTLTRGNSQQDELALHRLGTPDSTRHCCELV